MPKAHTVRGSSSQPHEYIYVITKVNDVGDWPAVVFSQESMMDTCVLLPPQSGIGHRGFPISYLTSTWSGDLQLSFNMASWIFGR